MSSEEKAYYRALRRSARLRTQFGDDVRNARLMSGVSQSAAGQAARISQPMVSRIEAGQSRSLSILDAVVLADAVGLDLSIKAYPGRRPTRDAGQARRLRRFLSHVRPPLRFATEVPLPARDGAPEQRAWDALLYAADGEAGVELEQRLYDVQAQTRRIFLKWRDSGVGRLLLVVADTRSNRQALREFPEYFTELPRLKTANVLATLASGQLPPSGLILF